MRCYDGSCVAEAEAAASAPTGCSAGAPWESAVVAVRARTYASALPSTLAVGILGGAGASLATLRVGLAAGAADIWVRAAPVAASVSHGLLSNSPQPSLPPAPPYLPLIQPISTPNSPGHASFHP